MPIQYALTINPIIYTACIEQFWATTKVKTVNREVQIQALVDKKKVIITETSVISDLQLEDAEEPVTNDTENVASVPTHFNDPPAYGEVKRLEKKGGSRTHRPRRLYKVGRSARVVSSKDKGLGDQEDASKRRKIDEINQDAEVTLVDETKGISIAAKPKARGVIVQEPSEFTTTTSPSQPSQLPQAKDKGKAKMVKPEKPLKKKVQIMFDKEMIKLESENLKKQKLDENVEAKVDDDQEEAEIKTHMEIVPDDEVAINDIPLATKPPIIVD
ncbi:hypothetical protein Tco_0026095 [Tanacetum coccineum]